MTRVSRLLGSCIVASMSVLGCSSESTNAGVGGASTGGAAGTGASSGSGGTNTGGTGGTAGGGTAGTTTGGTAGQAGAAGSAAGGTGGAGGCGNAVCEAGETLQNCVEDCNQWFYVTNATSTQTQPNVPKTWRGDLTFTVNNTFSIKFVDNTGNSNQEDNHTYLLDGSNGLSTDSNTTQGQISKDGEFIALAGVKDPLQVVMVRKGSGLSKASIANSTYTVRALTGNDATNAIWGLSATIKLNANACIDANSAGKRSDNVSIDFVSPTQSTGLGCAVVADNGQFTLEHNEASAGSTKKHKFEGWVGSGGDLIVWTHMDPTGFQPGLWIGVRTQSGHGSSKISGSYFVSHLINKNSVRGNIDLANGNVTGGTLATIASSGINVSSGGYTVLGTGELALTVTDANGTGYQAGQASNYTASGIAPVLVTTSVASGGDTGLSPNAPSLMFWVLK